MIAGLEWILTYMERFKSGASWLTRLGWEAIVVRLSSYVGDGNRRAFEGVLHPGVGREGT